MVICRRSSRGRSEPVGRPTDRPGKIACTTGYYQKYKVSPARLVENGERQMKYAEMSVASRLRLTAELVTMPVWNCSVAVSTNPDDVIGTVPGSALSKTAHRARSCVFLLRFRAS